MRFGPAIAALVTCLALGVATAALAGAPVPDAAGPSPDAGTPVDQQAPSLPDAAPGATAPVSTSADSKPLTVTPPLAALDYVFPVVGETAWGDSYGEPRADVPGKWHHGDDLFAQIGAPVIAVADGTLSDVGWEKVGGWRLWLTTSAGDSFYYAHLAGFTPLALNATQVRAGQVLGFVGNTGDADGGASHLHFEVHPLSLRSLDEDGAVDPTGYLRGWKHIRDVSFARPLLPKLPKGEPGTLAEAAYEELLSAPSIQQKLAHRAALRERRLARAQAEREARRAATAPASVVYPPPLVVERLAAPPAASVVAAKTSSGSRIALYAALAAAALAAGAFFLGIRRRLTR